ncbi:type II toxin-antitoxin system RelE/ParE family toxin [uncultured Arcticibacterium sp.]|uniref:type II toxin-antitoxin system RelE/ParE family toxin n=1 Tax=uncultured Arcticibacterium sp. TaxID=2173042 RepID=UPI0030FC6BAA
MLDLLAIEEYSIQKWGEGQTDNYLSELYEAFGKIAQNPESRTIRKGRSFPFYMASVGKHFAIYKTGKNGIIITTILHGRRNIEAIINALSHALTREIYALDLNG